MILGKEKKVGGIETLMKSVLFVAQRHNFVLAFFKELQIAHIISKGK